MSDDNKTDNKNVPSADLDNQGVPDIREETPETLKALRDDIAKMQDEHEKKVSQEADPNFWAGMTPAEILVYLGVSQEEFDRVFPADYKQIDKPINELTKEERELRISQTRERMRKIVKATNPDKAPMPNSQALIEKYTAEAADVLDFNPGLKSILEGVTQLQNSRRSYDQLRLNEAVKVASELLSFDAKKAKQLWLDNIKRDSNLHNILSTIHEQANKGNAKTTINYVSTYDQLKLAELGFTLIRTSGGGAEYAVSWSA